MGELVRAKEGLCTGSTQPFPGRTEKESLLLSTLAAVSIGLTLWTGTSISYSKTPGDAIVPPGTRNRVQG